MNFENEILVSQNRISISNLLLKIGLKDMQNTIIAGLTLDQKTISSKYFYNESGSQLFEEITHLEEYYPTRTEKEILKRIAPELMHKYANYDIIELGSGDSSKISILCDSVSNEKTGAITYLPFDVSHTAIQKSAQKLVSNSTNINVLGYVIDFFSQPEYIYRDNPAFICFFGSTIGNFEKHQSTELLKNISKSMKKGDVLLLGMDMIKPESVLHAAYNDKKGVTAAFNKNILNAVNDIIHSNFDINDFDHLAVYNKEFLRIEMHLVANKNVSIQSAILDDSIAFKKGDSIHTENSHKYTLKNILEIASATGLKIKNTNTDNKKWFSLVEFEK